MTPTDWFPGEIPPEHPGVYRRRLNSTFDEHWSRWDGQWFVGSFDYDEAAKSTMPSVIQTGASWRGVVKP